MYHSYQFNEWYRQIYSPLIQSEPKTLYNITILTKKPNFSLFQALLVLADLGWSQDNAEAVSFMSFNKKTLISNGKDSDDLHFTVAGEAPKI